MHPRHLPLIFATAALLASCDASAPMDTTDDDAGPRPLVSAYSWTQSAPEDDPFADMRPEGVVCNEEGLIIEPATEGDALEIDTAVCDYVTLEQGALNEAKAGEELEIHIWHSELDADQPATGYVGLAIGDEIVWEREVPIPSEAGPIDDTITLDQPIAFGEPLRVHVHNHGDNAWTLLRIEIP